jgi:hypothetical protein
MKASSRASRRAFLCQLGAAFAAGFLPAGQAQGAYPQASVYMSRSCGCCGEWVKHLRANGLAVPGMPSGAPGMEQGTPQPYSTIAFGRDGSRAFARHG